MNDDVTSRVSPPLIGSLKNVDVKVYSNAIPGRGKSSRFGTRSTGGDANFS